jgi:non-ribosomal peptide synthetase component E (peptide arylation enzyme)
MLVQDFLESSADHLPDKVALICDGRRLTFSEIEAQANRLANALQARGLRRGERVVTYLATYLFSVQDSLPISGVQSECAATSGG